MLIPVCLFAKTNSNSGSVLIGGNQSIRGIKNFTTAPTINSVPVDTTTSVNGKISALSTQFAPINGGDIQFSVATATSNEHIANKAQSDTLINAAAASNVYAGKYWTVATFPASVLGSTRCYHETLNYADKMWVIGGYDSQSFVKKSDVYYSNNGVTWTVATTTAAFGARLGFAAINYAGKMWVIGGSDSVGVEKADSWYSTDGITWTLATDTAAFGARRAMSYGVYNNKMWLIGGVNGSDMLVADIYYSTNGVTWTVATTTPAFGERMEAGFLNYAGKMWLIGGLDALRDYQDVWNSTDGITWTQVNSSAAFGTGHVRNNYCVNVYKGKMWLISGASLYNNDAWYSTDGITWTAASTSIFRKAKQGHSTLVYKGALWSIGGISANEAGTEIYRTRPSY